MKKQKSQEIIMRMPGSRDQEKKSRKHIYTACMHGSGGSGVGVAEYVRVRVRERGHYVAV